jgi:hypothetical protein
MDDKKDTAGALVTTANTNRGIVLSEELQGFDGFEDMGSGSLRVPRLKLVQPTSDEGTQGKIRNVLTGEEYDSIKGIIIKAQEARVMFPPGEVKSKQALCRSSNKIDQPTGFLYPDEDVEEKQSHACMRRQLMPGPGNIVREVDLCEQAKFGKDAKGDTIKAPCMKSLNLLVLDMETFMPAWFSVHGMGYGPTATFISGIRLRKLPSYAVPVTIATKQESNQKGKYYIPTYAMGKTFTPEEFAEWAPYVSAYKDAELKRTLDDEEAEMLAREAMEEDQANKEAEASQAAEQCASGGNRPSWIKKSSGDAANAGVGAQGQQTTMGQQTMQTAQGQAPEVIDVTPGNKGEKKPF